MRSVVAKIAVVSFLLTMVAGQAALRSALQEKENALARLAIRAEALYNGRCATLSNCRNGATTCTVPACGDDFPTTRGFNCTSQYGTNAALCGAGCPGMIRSQDTTVVRIPPQTEFTNAEVQAFVCSTVGMETEFKNQHNGGNGDIKAWSYLGHSSGAIRIYPGAPQGRTSSSCSTYDARLRPWYIAASSGPKDVVLVLDKSGSMGRESGFGDETRWDLLVPAVNALLDTLTSNDFVSIVAFSGAGEAFVVGGYTTLRRADTDNINAIKRAFAAIQPGGGTDFSSGFSRAFPLFTSSVEETSGCTRVILFLTDGEAQDSITDIRSTIATGQNQLRASGSRKAAHIFTFSMTFSSDDEKPRIIACENEGVWAKIADAENPLDKMRGYYQFLASGIDDTTVRWTTPYIDDFGLGRMVTAARAVYDRSASVPQLVGVVGADITIAELEQYGTFQGIVGEVIARGNRCPALNISECQIQFLREQQGYRCPAPAPTAATCQASGDVVTVQQCTAAGTLNDYFCSSLSSITRLGSSRSSDGEVSCCRESGCRAGGAGAFSMTMALVVAIASVLMTVLF